MTTAYIYKWIHIPTNKWYIGCRTKENCHPGDGYICSSKIVKPLIEKAPKDWQREILHTGAPADIILLEAQILKKLDAKNDKNSYNLHNGDGDFSTAGIVMSEDWRRKISQSNTGKKKSIESKENYKRANQLKAKDPAYLEKLRKPKPEGHGEKVSKATKGVAKTPEHRKAMSEARKGKQTGPCSEKRKEAIRAALKGKHTLSLVICPHCGLEGRANMRRWHFDNCKKNI
jgi:hypothetical protein